MSAQVVVQGTLKADGTLELDRKPELPPGRVRIIVQLMPELPTTDPFWRMMEEIWAAQKTQGHVPRSAQQVAAERQAIRDEWEQRMQEIDRVQTEARAARGPGESS